MPRLCDIAAYSHFLYLKGFKMLQFPSTRWGPLTKKSLMWSTCNQRYIIYVEYLYIYMVNL